MDSVECIIQAVGDRDRQVQTQHDSETHRQDKREDLRVDPGNRRGQTYQHQHPRVLDSESTEILIGETVTFITRGWLTSTSGVVYKISRNGTRVTSRDNLRQSISRAPHNLCVKL